VVGDGASRGDVGLRSDTGFSSLDAGGDACSSLALLVGLGPGQALGLGGDGDCSGVLDQVESFFDFWFGLGGGFGLGCGGDARTAGGLEFVQATLGFVGFAVGRFFGLGRLTLRFFCGQRSRNRRVISGRKPTIGEMWLL
jgi:hypothetical protein